MSQLAPKTSLAEAIDHLHNELYAIQQQLSLFSELTSREVIDGEPISIMPTSFSVTMFGLAEQVHAAMDYTIALYRYVSADIHAPKKK